MHIEISRYQKVYSTLPSKEKCIEIKKKCAYKFWNNFSRNEEKKKERGQISWNIIVL